QPRAVALAVEAGDERGGPLPARRARQRDRRAEASSGRRHRAAGGLARERATAAGRARERPPVRALRAAVVVAEARLPRRGRVRLVDPRRDRAVVARLAHQLRTAAALLRARVAVRLPRPDRDRDDGELHRRRRALHGRARGAAGAAGRSPRRGDAVRGRSHAIAGGREHLRILSAGNLYPPHYAGGYELMWRTWVEHARAAGHVVRVLCSDERTDATGAGDPDVHRELRRYWRATGSPKLSLRERLALERYDAAVVRRHLDELEPDVVVWWGMGGMALSSIEQVRRAGFPAVAFV